MAFAEVAHLSEGTTADGGTTSAINTTGAAVLVAILAWYPGGGTPTFADSKGNTWVPLTIRENLQNAAACRVLYVISGAVVGSGHTFTASGTGVYPSIHVIAFSASGVVSFDLQNGAGSNGIVATFQAGAITPSADNALVIAGTAIGDVQSISSINGGFTQYSVGTSDGNYVGGGIASLVQGAAASANPTWTYSSDTTAAAAIASFTEAGGPPAGPTMGYLDANRLRPRIFAPGHAR